MTEQVTTARAVAPPTTGVADVDEVVGELAAAFALPVTEQATALERAHDRLRRALDQPDPAA